MSYISQEKCDVRLTSTVCSRVLLSDHQLVLKELLVIIWRGVAAGVKQPQVVREMFTLILFNLVAVLSALLFLPVAALCLHHTAIRWKPYKTEKSFNLFFHVTPDRLRRFCVQWAEYLSKKIYLLRFRRQRRSQFKKTLTHPITAYRCNTWHTHTVHIASHNTIADSFVKRPLSCLHAAFVLHCT